MRAKTAVKLRARGTAFKCDLCGRKLMTMDALIIHQRTAHNVITRRNKPKQVNKPLKSVKPQVKEKLVKKEPTLPKNTQKVKFSELEKEVNKKEEKVDPPVNQDNATLKKKTVEFQCPKCFSIFGTYFPAHKHIQKYHCVNKHGAKVPPNSPSLIQPVKIELCHKCNRKVKSIQTHLCDEELKKNEDQVVICTACEDWLPNLKSFDSHILSSHADDVESMFFPLNIDFINWKSDMEAQTGVNYVVLEKYDTKRFYHCDYTKETQEKVNATHICPSVIVVQEFPKGIQVHFFKKHFKHSPAQYCLTDKYKKFTITSFLRRSKEYNNLTSLSSDENDLYMQFKSLMEGIIVDAAKINIETLKILHGKALNMTCILTNYDEETEDNDNGMSVEYSKMSSGKRKNDEVEVTVEVKKTKECVEEHEMSPKILNSFSLATNERVNNDIDNKKEDVTDKNSDGENEEGEEVKNNKKGNDWDPYSSSFNDSYKDFVVKNFPTMEKEMKKKVKKPVVKTKIGQFKPSLSPKSPKTPEESKVKEKNPHRLSFDKPIVDLKYEVKEQEDGCNILILKV